MDCSGAVVVGRQVCVKEGECARFAVRFVVHDGDVEEAGVARMWGEFVGGWSCQRCCDVAMLQGSPRAKCFPWRQLTSLNINYAETCKLADELARVTGETTTGALTIALNECLERERRIRDATLQAQELHAIGQRCAALLAPGPAAVE